MFFLPFNIIASICKTQHHYYTAMYIVVDKTTTNSIKRICESVVQDDDEDYITSCNNLRSASTNLQDA